MMAHSVYRKHKNRGEAFPLREEITVFQAGLCAIPQVTTREDAKNGDEESIRIYSDSPAIL